MSALQQFITDVHARIAELDAEIPAVLGAKNWSTHVAPPCIKWAYSNVGWVTPDTVGGQKEHIITRIQTFDIAIWCDTEEACSDVLDNLIRACRTIAKGRPNFEPKPFEWLTESEASWLSRGCALVGKISVRFQVTRLPTPHPLATLTSHSHTEDLDV